MRFHRITINNINSLYDKQVVDLEKGLGGAGLFLIHGPTGAGKSTILDAICLALYARTPRLDDKTIKNAAEIDGVSASDPKNVMSRGAGTCAAEVEFSIAGADGVSERWRASWTVRRARDNPAGKIQEPTRALWRLLPSGQWELQVDSAKKKDFEEPFAKALQWLSFEDFQRTTLLAQFAFREFLEAGEDKRAELLERMTATGNYRAIGLRAYEARRKAVDKAKLLEAQTEGRPLLSVEDEGAKRNELTACEGAVGAFASELATVERERAYWVELVRRGLAVVSSRAEVEAVLSEREAAEPELDRLALDETVAPARSALATSRSAQHDQEAIERDRGQAAAELEANRGHVATRSAQKDETARVRSVVEQEGAALEAPLVAAEAAWRERGEATKAEAEARATGVVRETEHAAATGRAESTSQVAGQVKVDLEAARVSLDTIPQHTRLAEVVAVVVAGMESLKDEKKALSKLQKQAAERERKREEALAGSDGFALDGGRVEAAAMAAREWVARAEGAVQALSGGEAPERLQARWGREELARADQVRDLGQLESALTGLEGLKADGARFEVERAELDAKHRVDTQKVVEQEEAIGRDEEGREREIARISIFEKILHVVEQREVLTEGLACPLCGSPEHPYVREPETAPLSDEVRREKAQVEAVLVETERRLKGAKTALKAAQRRVDTAATQVLGKVEQLDALAARQAKLGEDIAAIEVRLGVGPGVEARAEWGARLDVQAHAFAMRATDWERCALEEREARAALGAAGQALVAHEKLRITRDAELANLVEKVEADKAAIVETSQKIGQHEADLYERLREVEVVESNLMSAVAALHERHLRAIELTGEVARLGEMKGRVELEAAKAKERLERAVVELGAAHEATVRAVSRREAAEASVTGHFEGREPRLIREELAAALRVAVEADDEAVRALAVVKEALAGWVARALALGEQGAKALEKVLATRADFEAACSLAAIAADEEEVLASSIEEPQREASRRLREVLGTRATTARVRAAAVDDALSAHRAAKPEGVGDEGDSGATEQRVAVLDQRRQTLDEERSAVEQKVGALREELARNELERGVKAELEAKFQVAQKNASYWSPIADLIGINEGKAFVAIVQALNFSAVIQLANARLSRFMRRYSLKQVDDKNGTPRLDFVVIDGFNQGAPRTVKSLSGGESFIVSLALALGLADLRSSRLRIETLLIDEGFGSLDGKTLQEVLDALTALQAASGAQIGLISHVESMREAIPAQIAVVPIANGRSKVEVRA